MSTRQSDGTASGCSPVPRLVSRSPAISTRHVLSVLDLSPTEVTYLCRRAIALKHSSSDPATLRGRAVGVYFRKPSTRTRTSFVVAAGRLGATTICYAPDDLQTTTGETTADTARVLARYLDVLVLRTNESTEEMKTFAAAGAMSVVNALSDREHPTQALADFTTMLEHFGRLEGLSILYCGEGNKTAAGLALAVSRVPAMGLTIATPAGYSLDAATLQMARGLAARYGGSIEQVHDLCSTRRPVDVVYTSRWQEMGVGKPDPDWKRRFEPFRVTRSLMERISGPATVFMHDLPAVRGEDVDSDVLDGPRSLAWVQAEHKLFSAMSVLEWCGAGVVDPRLFEEAAGASPVAGTSGAMLAGSLT